MRLIFSDPNAYPGSRAIFLDRDGVINRRVIGDYVRHWQNFSFLPGVLRAVKSLNALQVPIIVVSNQAGVAKGLMSERDLRELTLAFTDAFASYGGRIDSVYHGCPVKGRTESVGWEDRITLLGSHLSEGSVKWAFSRTR